MDVAYFSALAALAGSVIGGLTSAMTTWLNQRTQARAGQRAHEISLREDLFKDFIVAASHSYGKALTSSDPQIEEIVNLYSLVSRMRVLCLPRTVASAEKIMVVTTETYFEPNKTFRDVHEIVKSGVDVDPLKDFAECAREELRTLSASI